LPGNTIVICSTELAKDIGDSGKTPASFLFSGEEDATFILRAYPELLIWDQGVNPKSCTDFFGFIVKSDRLERTSSGNHCIVLFHRNLSSDYA
jgi:hypothetical protein